MNDRQNAEQGERDKGHKPDARLQEGVILRRNDATRDHADIFASPFFQRFDQFRDQRFMTGSREDAPTT